MSHTTDLDLKIFINEFDRVMSVGYGITSVDMGLDEDQLARIHAWKQSPREVVDFYAEKYDLTPVRPFSWTES